MIGSLAFLLLFSAFHLGAQTESIQSDSPVSILIFGNSVVYWNGGPGMILEQLAASDSPQIKLKAAQVTASMSTIKMIWDRYENALPTGPFDFVVLQDTLNVNIYGHNTTEELYEYAAKIDKWARTQGGKAVILVDWVPPMFRTKLSLADRLTIFDDLADRLQIDVAPFGYEWERIDKEKPKMNLYASDGSHPGRPATYLMACVLYATIFKSNPIGLSYDAKYLSNENAAYLQSIAWQTCLAYEFAHVKRHTD